MYVEMVERGNRMKCANCRNIRLVQDFEGSYYWCDKVEDSPVLDMERKCEHYSVATGGDLIRRMTNAELVFLIQEFKDCPKAFGMVNYCNENSCEECSNIAIQSEVDE